MANYPYFPVRYFPLEAAGGGVVDYPEVFNVLDTDTVDGVAGTYHPVSIAEVKYGIAFGPSSTLTGTYGQSTPTGEQDDILQLTTALMGRFTDVANDLNTSIGGRLYKGRAPEEARFPYAVYFVVSDVQVDTFKDRHNNVIIQFDLFSASSSTLEVEQMYDHLKALYDDCTMIPTGSTLVYMVRQGAQYMVEEIDTKDGTRQVHHYAVDYEIIQQQ
jgi:hypothetical protein